MTWCERCAVGIHFHCANDHALEHAGEDCIGYYRAKDIAAKSGLCHDCWSTYKPYVDESDEDEIDADTNPERHPNRLRWRWPGRLKEALDAEAKRERSARAAAGGSQAADGGRTARRSKRTATADNGRTARRPRRATADRQAIPPTGAAPTSGRGATPWTHSRTHSAPPRPTRPPDASPPAEEPPGSPASPRASANTAPGSPPPT